MAQYSVGEALKKLLEQARWKNKVLDIRLRQEWEEIVGKTIAKYTNSVMLKDKKLFIYTDVAALKMELNFGKEQLKHKINAHFDDKVVEEIIIK